MEGMVVSVFTKLSLFLGRGQDGGFPWASPKVLKATGRDNGTQHLALAPNEYVLPEVGRLFVSKSTTAGARSLLAHLQILGPHTHTRKGQAPTKPGILQVWEQVFPPWSPCLGCCPGPIQHPHKACS